jgi:hypothetical protein
MIEIEFSALSRQCLNRRIPTRQQMEREVLALVQERERKAIKINWQFSIPKARTTFQNRYTDLLKCNDT